MDRSASPWTHAIDRSASDVGAHPDSSASTLPPIGPRRSRMITPNGDNSLTAPAESLMCTMAGTDLQGRRADGGCEMVRRPAQERARAGGNPWSRRAGLRHLLSTDAGDARLSWQLA